MRPGRLLGAAVLSVILGAAAAAVADTLDAGARA
jgi:hypothetical protein